MTDLTDERLRDVAEFHRDPVTRNIARELLAHRTNGGDPVRVWDDDAKCWREPTASPVSIPQDDPQSIASLLSIIADIREASGVGAKPMLSELAEAIRAKLPQDGTSGGRVDEAMVVRAQRAVAEALDTYGEFATEAIARAALLAALEPSP